MNYMKEFLQLLGLEIGEEFKVNINGLVLEKNFYINQYGAFMVGDKSPTNSVLNGILLGKYEVIKLPKTILDDVEKEYLSAVIKPFRNQIKFIFKLTTYSNNREEYLAIVFNGNCLRHMCFPNFKKNTMYKGMELEKKYSLEELGL